MDWIKCQQRKLAKRITIDVALATSLKEVAHNKQITQKLLPLNEITAASKITLAYDAVRETLEALAVVRGWQIYNHECYCSFLGEILSQPLIGRIFDQLRKIRNDINYDGKDISLAEAKLRLEQLESILETIKGL
jgi:hypothetical protein